MAFRNHSGTDDDMMSEINVTPLVDVMLVLLVVFIITAPLLAPQALKISLPRTQAVNKENLKPSRLAVDAQGGLELNGRVMDDQALAQELMSHASDPGFQLQIAADKAVPYGRIAELMALAQHAGVAKLTFVTFAAK